MFASEGSIANAGANTRLGIHDREHAEPSSARRDRLSKDFSPRDNRPYP